MDYRKFKDTEIERIPKEWEVVRLGDKKISKELFYGITAKATNKDTGLRMLRTTDIKNYSVNWESLPFCEITEKREDLSRYFLKEGDLIIARAGTVGISVLVDKDYKNVIFGSYLIKVILNSTVNPKFLHYFLQSHLYWSHLRKAQGSTLKNINLPLLKSLLIPLPPLPEQRRIAEILSTVDDAIQKVDAAITKTERLKKGLLHELLTKGIGHKEFKDTEIGRIPKEWEVVRLREVISLYQNGIWGEDPVPLQKSYPVIRSTEITHDGKLDLSTVAYRRIPDEKVAKYKLQDGDILMVASSGSANLIGRVTLFKQPEDNKIYLFSNFMIRIRPRDIDPHFLYYFLSSPRYYHFLRSLQQTSTGLRNLPKKDFLRLKIPLPPLPEQRRIAEILSTVDQKLDLLKRRKEKLIRIKKGLMNDLLTGKRRVKLNA